MFDELILVAVKSLYEASRKGVLLQSGKRVHLMPLGLKGDWSFLAAGMNIAGSFVYMGKERVCLCVCV